MEPIRSQSETGGHQVDLALDQGSDHAIPAAIDQAAPFAVVASKKLAGKVELLLQDLQDLDPKVISADTYAVLSVFLPG